MNRKLFEDILKVKQYLNEKPERIMVGWVNEGIPDEEINERNLKEYYEFLKVCDGASFGDIYFF